MLKSLKISSVRKQIRGCLDLAGINTIDQLLRANSYQPICKQLLDTSSIVLLQLPAATALGTRDTTALLPRLDLHQYKRMVPRLDLHQVQENESTHFCIDCESEQCSALQIHPRPSSSIKFPRSISVSSVVFLSSA